MNLKSKILALGFVAKVFAAEFSVVSFNGACQVNVGGNLYPMNQEAGLPIYKANVDAQVGTSYKYVCGGVDDVERVLSGDKTHNELVGRPITMYDMPEFYYPTDEPWTRSIGRGELFDPKYVPIVVVDGNKEFFVKAGSTTFNKVTFILQDNVYSFDQVSSSAKNTEEDKFQFKVELPGDGIFYRTTLKFRPSSNDPVFFRQILYGDILHAIGNPTHESIAARVYLSDGTPIGLYVLQDDCTSESFIRTAFFGDPQTQTIKPYTPNVIYDCSTGADFTAADGKFLGSFQNNTDDSKWQLLEMTQRLEQLNIQDVNAISQFDQNDLDLDIIFKALALEYLAGHWDSYWFYSTNFVTYHPNDDGASGYRFYFVDQDFDQTWGANMYPELDPQNYPNRPYTNYIGVKWKQLNHQELDTETRIIVDKLIGCEGQPSCPTKELFEKHLKSIVQHIFNPVAIKRKTDGYKERLVDEIQWDLSFQRLHTGTQQRYHFTMNDFNYGIEFADYEGSLFFWGILDWTTAICNTVCNQFGITYDPVPLTPETANQVTPEPAGPIGGPDASSGLMTRANIAFVVMAALLSILFL